MISYPQTDRNVAFKGFVSYKISDKNKVAILNDSFVAFQKDMPPQDTLEITEKVEETEPGFKRSFLEFVYTPGDKSKKAGLEKKEYKTDSDFASINWFKWKIAEIIKQSKGKEGKWLLLILITLI